MTAYRVHHNIKGGERVLEDVKVLVAVPHDVNIYERCYFDQSIHKYVKAEGQTPIVVLPRSGILLNAKTAVEELPNLFGIIPDCRKRIESCDDYPEGYDLVIVSALYASAYLKTHEGKFPSSMRLVADPVVDKDGNIVGCMRLTQPF
jgi:hypothetical protein